MHYSWVISSVPVSHIVSTREGMQYPWVISSVPVSHILSTHEDMQYPWVISSVPMRICSTRESYHQYLWVISSVPVSHILSTCEDMQYPWVISSVPVVHILSAHEDMQYPWVNLYEWRMNETSLTGTAYPHRYWGYDSRVLRIWLTGTAYPHRYWWYDSRVLHILTGTEGMTHGYWGYDSRVLMIWLTGNAYPHRYCIPSRVLHIVYTGWKITSKREYHHILKRKKNSVKCRARDSNLAPLVYKASVLPIELSFWMKNCKKIMTIYIWFVVQQTVG